MSFTVLIKLSAGPAGLQFLKESPSKYSFVGFPATRYLSAHLKRRKETNIKTIITEFPNWSKNKGSVFFQKRERGTKIVHYMQRMVNHNTSEFLSSDTGS